MADENLVSATVTINLKGLKRFGAAVEAQTSRGAPGPMSDMLKQWAARYRGYLMKRFVRNSRGGGEWADLKASTVARRRGGGKVGKKVNTAAGVQALGRVAILRDTGTLFRVVQPAFTGAPGQLEDRIPYGIRVGYGGPGRYPDGKATVADVASFHQEGAGNLPVRKIIVPPDAATISGMREDAERAMQKLADQGRD